MSALELYIFLILTFGHFISVPLCLKQFGGSKFFCLEEYLFYAAFFSVGSFYLVLHLIWLMGGMSLWKGLIAFSILHFCLWQTFVKVRASRDDKPHKFDSIKSLDIIVFFLVAAVIGQWINLAYQHDRVSGFDALHYHLPHIANFAAGEPLLGLLSTGHLYPMSHALLGGWLFMGFGSPLVVDWLNIPAFVLIFSSFSLLLRILANRSGFIWALLVGVILFSSDMLEDVTKVSADLSHASSYLALFTILTSIAAKQQLDRLEWFALTICLGLVIGSKSPGLSLIFITIAVFLCLKVVGLFEFKIIRPDIKYSLLYVLLFIFSGGIWLFRNWYLFGSPIAPVGVSIFGFELFNGISFDRLRYYLSALKDMRDIPDYNFLHHLYLSTQRWYGDYYLLLYSFSGMLFLDTFLSRHFRGKTIINAKETIPLKYGLLILYVFTFLVQGCLLIGAPFSSLNILKGAAVRYMLPLVLCSFPMFFSFVIPKESHTGIRDYPAWITALVLLLISVHLNWTISYYRMGLVQYPSFLWICLAAVPFIAWALYYHGFNQIKAIYLLPSALVLLTVFYGDILEKSYQALMKSKIGFHRDAARYILHGKTYDIYKEILLKVYQLKKRYKLSSQTDRFFLLSRLDFPVNLLGPVYTDRVWDIHNEILREGAKRVGFRFEPDKYCEFLIAVQNTTASDQQKGKDMDLIKNQVADFLPGNAYILKAFSISNILLYQVFSKQPQGR